MQSPQRAHILTAPLQRMASQAATGTWNQAPVRGRCTVKKLRHGSTYIYIYIHTSICVQINICCIYTVYGHALFLFLSTLHSLFRLYLCTSLRQGLSTHRDPDTSAGYPLATSVRVVPNFIKGLMYLFNEMVGWAPSAFFEMGWGEGSVKSCHRFPFYKWGGYTPPTHFIRGI